MAMTINGITNAPNRSLSRIETRREPLSFTTAIVALFTGFLLLFDKLFHSKHHYVNRIYLGKFNNLTTKQVMDVVKNCNIFPMTVLKGGIRNRGDKALITLHCLAFLRGSCKTGNLVTVKEAGDNFILLEANDNHFFKGTARHEIIKKDNEFYWQVTGDSPEEGEELWRSILNILFSKLRVWDFLIQTHVVPKLRRMENEITPIPEHPLIS